MSQSFEAVRSLAAQLNQHLVAEGADALNPENLISHAIRHFDLELTFLKPGDPALKGCRALYDDQSGTICAEKASSPAQSALLIAHEIGHLVVHAGPCSCSHEDIDTSRSTETAPVGLQRVEDYGAHERRELEANVFAREFIFPRTRAHNRFVDGRESASDLAARTGLPLPLVRQQILDAALLPKPDTETPPPLAPVTRDDPAQEKAAIHRGTPYQLRAGPGTGKTRSLVRRVESLLADQVQPAAILILTFSNRTAGELFERLDHKLGERAPAIWVGTFHGFGLDLIRRFHDRLGLPADPVLFDRSDAIAVLEDILPTLPLRHYKNLWDPVVVLREILQAISRAKDEMVTAADYRTLAQDQHARALASGDDEAIKAAEKVCEIASVYALYEAAKSARQAVDFGDLILLPTQILESDEFARSATRLRHRHVLVDEYQDVNRASVRLVKALAGEGKNLWVVGDARQSIYRFRGASSHNMSAFNTDFPTAFWDPLGINYRSTQAIVDAYIGFAAQMPLPPTLAKLELKADRGAGTAKPEVRGFDRPEDEAAGVAASIKELEAKGVALRHQAILCRTNSRIDEIAQTLEDRGIPVLHLGSLFERSGIRDLLALMSLAADPYGAGLVRAFAMPRYQAPLQDMKRAIDHLKGGDEPALLRLNELASLSSLSEAGREAAARLAADLTGLKPADQPWDFLTTLLLDRTDMVRSLATPVAIEDRMHGIAIWQFLNFLREQSPVQRGLPIHTALERVRNLVLLAEERDLRQVPEAALQMNAVRLMTIHASKGLEFEAVHVPGLTVNSVPSSYRGSRCPPPENMVSGASGTVAEQGRSAHDQEECLFFVAMSRARTYLIVSYARFQKNGSNRSASPYLPRIAPNTVRNEAAPRLRSPVARPDSHIAVTMQTGWAPIDRSLIAYEKCPRRFFYTHLLGIDTARRRTIFERTHSCIYTLIDWLAKTRLAVAPTREETHAQFEKIWNELGLHDFERAADYRALATQLVDGLVNVSAGRIFREARPLAIDFSNGRILVEPSEIAERDGVVVIRRIRSGRRGDKEFDKLEYYLYQQAAARHFGASSVVEAIHLTDSEAVDVPALSARMTTGRLEKTEALLAALGKGRFDPSPDAFTCPRCPHFFICPATPHGDLTIT